MTSKIEQSGVFEKNTCSIRLGRYADDHVPSLGDSLGNSGLRPIMLVVAIKASLCNSAFASTKKEVPIACCMPLIQKRLQDLQVGTSDVSDVYCKEGPEMS